ncbi:MAG: hypothetical protein WBP33_17515 [Saprospiraceae bacterium]
MSKSKNSIMDSKSFDPIDQYFAQQQEDVVPILANIKQVIAEVAPVYYSPMVSIN